MKPIVGFTLFYLALNFVIAYVSGALPIPVVLGFSAMSFVVAVFLAQKFLFTSNIFLNCTFTSLWAGKIFAEGFWLQFLGGAVLVLSGVVMLLTIYESISRWNENKKL